MTDSDLTTAQGNNQLTCPQCGFINPVGFNFCGQCGTSLTSIDPSLSSDAERRQLTVLFCDLIDSVVWSRRLDPEDFRQVLGLYRAVCQKYINHYEGTHVRFIGDGVRAYFGYPNAHEDDAERAVRAGLEIAQQVPALFWRAESIDSLDPLAVRIGIATGQVVAGKMLSADISASAEAVGETPNLAARIQTLAAPNSVVIAEATRNLLGQLFELRDLREHRLKGFTQPVRVWEVRALRSTLSRYEAIRNLATPLINREAENIRMVMGWERVQNGYGQVILLRGEAGIGKSRLVQQLRYQITEPKSFTLLNFQCSPYHINSPLYPIATQLEHAAKIVATDDEQTKKLKLQRVIPVAGHERESSIHLFLSLFGLTTQQSEFERTPAERRSMLLQALLTQLKQLASRQAVIVIFEDLHWIDPSSLELLQQGIASIQDLPVLMLLTARSDFVPPWPALAYYCCLDMDRLHGHEIEAIIHNLALHKDVPKQLLEYVNNLAGGNPLYAEELTKTLLQDRALVREEDSAYQLIDKLPEHAVPSTLQDLLIARLDKLSPLKAVAQTAALIGQEIHLSLLAQVVQLSQTQTLSHLEQLVQAQILERSVLHDQTVYTFRHAVLQEAAYESLLKRRRRELHQRVATLMEQNFPAFWQHQPEILAHHFDEAQLNAQAIHYWLIAGQLAGRRYANHEAVHHLERGLGLLASLSNVPQRKNQELALRIALGPALIATAGPGAEKVQKNYQLAVNLCAELPESPEHFAAYWGWWRVGGDFLIMQSRAQQMLRLAERLDDAGLRLQAHHSMWASLFHLGQPAESFQHIQRGLTLYQEGDFRTHASIYGGHDAKACALGEAAQALWLLGYPEQAQQWMSNALEWAEALQHEGSLLHVFDMGMLLAYYLLDIENVNQFARRVGELAAKKDIPDYVAKGRFFQAWVQTQTDHKASGLVMMKEALQSLQKVGTSEDMPVFCDMLAQAYSDQHDLTKGLAQLDIGLAQATSDHTHTWLAELHRRRGELLRLLEPADPAQALACFEQAIAITQPQQAKSLELRAVSSWAECLLAQGEAIQAKTRLTTIYEAFREGHDTPDLRRAAELLQTLQKHL